MTEEYGFSKMSETGGPVTAPVMKVTGMPLISESRTKWVKLIYSSTVTGRDIKLPGVIPLCIGRKGNGIRLR